jgi:hypothetical protein
MQNYFNVLKALFAVASDDFDMVGNYTSLLHSIRPLHVPVFGFVRIEPASHCQFLVNMISNHANFMMTMICDFIVAVGLPNESASQAVFNRLRCGPLPFLLIIAHDFPPFVATVAPESVTVLPQLFLQVRNLVLSRQPAGIQTVPVLAARTALASVPTIDSLSAALVAAA